MTSLHTRSHVKTLIDDSQRYNPLQKKNMPFPPSLSHNRRACPRSRCCRTVFRSHSNGLCVAATTLLRHQYPLSSVVGCAPTTTQPFLLLRKEEATNSHYTDPNLLVSLNGLCYPASASINVVSSFLCWLGTCATFFLLRKEEAAGESLDRRTSRVTSKSTTEATIDRTLSKAAKQTSNTVFQALVFEERTEAAPTQLQVDFARRQTQSIQHRPNRHTTPSVDEDNNNNDDKYHTNNKLNTNSIVES